MAANTRWWDYVTDIPVGTRFRQGGPPPAFTFLRAGQDCVIDEYPLNPGLYTPEWVDLFWRNEHGWVEVPAA